MAHFSFVEEIVLKFGTIVPIDESELNELMRIESNNLMAATEILRNPSAAARRAPRHALPIFNESQRLNQALTNAPEVRAEKVARGKALVADPNYPSKEQVKKIASLLAARWDNPDSLTTTSAASTRQMTKLRDNASALA